MQSTSQCNMKQKNVFSYCLVHQYCCFCKKNLMKNLEEFICGDYQLKLNN